MLTIFDKGRRLLLIPIVYISLHPRHRSNQTRLADIQIFGKYHLVDGAQLLHLHYVSRIQLHTISEKHPHFVGSSDASLFVLSCYHNHRMEYYDNIYELLSLSCAMKKRKTGTVIRQHLKSEACDCLRQTKIRNELDDVTTVPCTN